MEPKYFLIIPFNVLDFVLGNQTNLCAVEWGKKMQLHHCYLGMAFTVFILRVGTIPAILNVYRFHRVLNFFFFEVSNSFYWYHFWGTHNFLVTFVPIYWGSEATKKTTKFWCFFCLFFTAFTFQDKLGYIFNRLDFF